MLKKVLPILIVLVLFVGLSLYFFKKQEKPRGLLILHGRVEGKEINITLIVYTATILNFRKRM
jgi:HlyD family secretion protein